MTKSTSTATAAAHKSGNFLKDKVALVTGASSGIGEVTAVALAHAGVKASLMARREDRLTALSDKIATDGLERPIYFSSDVQKIADIEKAVKTF